MSVDNKSNIYKKTSFLQSLNSSFIDKIYDQYISDPKSVSADWREFFEGLNEDKKIVSKNLTGPSGTKNKEIKFNQKK